MSEQRSSLPIFLVRRDDGQRRLREEMSKKVGGVPDKWSTLSIISSLLEQGHPKEALELFLGLKREEIPTDSTSGCRLDDLFEMEDLDRVVRYMVNNSTWDNGGSSPQDGEVCFHVHYGEFLVIKPGYITDKILEIQRLNRQRRA